MKFFELAEVWQELEGTASRNAMTEMLSELFKTVETEEISKVCYLSLGRLAPLYRRIEFNLADKMVMRALGLAYDVDLAEVSKVYKELGDLGLVVGEIKNQKSKIKSTSKNSKLSVGEVYEQLMIVAKDSGGGSQERKVEGLSTLLKSLTGVEAKYVVRIVLGRLRLGFSDKTILDALSVMETGGKGARAELELAYQMFPDVGTVAELTKKHGSKDIEKRVQVTLGVPVLPALCQRLKTAEEMIKKMGEVIVEPKFDGTRVQIHYQVGRGDSSEIPSRRATNSRSTGRDDTSELNSISDVSSEGVLRTFTRNLDETTHMFPELKEGVKQIGAKSVIFDSEAVGVYPETGELLPFQATITRKRKHGIEEASRQVPLKFFVFDVLYVDGESLLDRPLSERREMLGKLIGKGQVLDISEMIVTEDPDALRKYHAAQLSDGLEGAVIKKIDGPYIPGRRGWNWVKFKEVEEAAGKLSDTLDVVVMGFYRGKGKRAQFGIGAFLVGVRDGEEIKTVAKIGTGLSDEQWQELRKRLELEVSVEMPKEYEVDKSLHPDVWVDPEVVVEVAADEVTKSPNHSSGYALRFPRLVKFRDDKSVGQVTSVGEVEGMK